MKIIEKPVLQIEKGSDLREIVLVVVALLKSLKHIYDSSNFYKEARIISFIDRLLESIISKIKLFITVNKCIIKGK